MNNKSKKNKFLKFKDMDKLVHVDLFFLQINPRSISLLAYSFTTYQQHQAVLALPSLLYWSHSLSLWISQILNIVYKRAMRTALFICISLLNNKIRFKKFWEKSCLLCLLLHNWTKNLFMYGKNDYLHLGEIYTSYTVS